MLILIIFNTIILVALLITGFKLINENNENEFQTSLTRWFFDDAQIYHIEQMKEMDREIRRLKKWERKRDYKTGKFIKE